MTGDNEWYKKRRYVTECSACGAMVSTLEYAGTRKDGRWVRCETTFELGDGDGGDESDETTTTVWRCGTLNWATESAETRPARWNGNRPDPETVIERIERADPAKVEGSA